MLIRSATIDRRQPARNQSFALAILYLVFITFWLASCLNLVAQETQPAADGPQPAVDKLPYDSEDIAKEFQMPRDPGEDASKDDQRAYRTQAREIRERIRNAERSIKTALTGSGNLAGVEGGFENFMRGYVFPRMTQTDNETLSTLGEIRKDFINDYLSDDVLGSERQQVITITIPAMQAILENAGGKNYHEAARLNAILLLGMIDAQPASRNNNTFPTASPQAFQILVDVFTGDKYPPFLKIGALAGIQRQVEIDYMQGQPQLPNRNQISQEAIRILQAPVTTDADYWLKRRSLQVLGYLGDVGPNGTVLTEISTIAADDNENKWLRFDAITALGNLKYDASVKALAQEVPVTVARYMAEMLDFGSTELKNKLNDLITKNLLFEDLDLIKQGNADQEKAGRGGNRGSGIGSGGGAGLTGDDPLPGAKDPAKKLDLGPRVELANYHLNDARLKAKVIAYTAKKTISTASLADFVDKSFVDNLNAELDTLIAEADIGIKNLDEEEPLFNPDDLEAVAKAKKADTIKMAELFADYAKRIYGMIPEKPVAAKADTAEPAKPAEDPLPNGGN